MKNTVSLDMSRRAIKTQCHVFLDSEHWVTTEHGVRPAIPYAVIGYLSLGEAGERELKSFA